MKGGRQGGVVRGALGIALAYVLFLNVFLAGFAAERMFVSAAAGLDVLCMGEAASPSGGDERPTPSGAAHCIICTFAKLTPLLNAPAPTVAPARPYEVAFAGPAQDEGAPRKAWRLPRQSRGPPAPRA